MLENKRRDFRLSCDIAIVYFRTVISVVVNLLGIKNGVMKGVLIRINFTAVASEVVASVVSRYEKAHLREK